MAIQVSHVTVGTTATLLATAPKKGVSEVQIASSTLGGGDQLFLGGSSVTTSNGFAWNANSGTVDYSTAFKCTLTSSDDDLYGCTVAGTQGVSVFQTGA